MRESQPADGCRDSRRDTVSWRHCSLRQIRRLRDLALLPNASRRDEGQHCWRARRLPRAREAYIWRRPNAYPSRWPVGGSRRSNRSPTRLASGQPRAPVPRKSTGGAGAGGSARQPARLHVFVAREPSVQVGASARVGNVVHDAPMLISNLLCVCGRTARMSSRAERGWPRPRWREWQSPSAGRRSSRWMQIRRGRSPGRRLLFACRRVNKAPAIAPNRLAAIVWPARARQPAAGPFAAVAAKSDNIEHTKYSSRWHHSTMGARDPPPREASCRSLIVGR